MSVGMYTAREHNNQQCGANECNKYSPRLTEVRNAQDSVNFATLIRSCAKSRQDHSLYLGDLLTSQNSPEPVHVIVPGISRTLRQDGANDGMLSEHLQGEKEKAESDILEYQHILTLTNLRPTEQAAPEQVVQCDLQTGGALGFLGCRSTCLQLQSRFFWDDRYDPERRHDYFLWYMLERITTLTFFRSLELGQEAQLPEEGIDYLLLFAFAHQLQTAVRQGMFRAYRVRAYNDLRVHGSVDLTRQLRHNLPFTGRIACRATEYDCSNSLTQLIRHTLEYIKSQRRYAEICRALRRNADYMSAVRQINEVTAADYRSQERQAIMQANLRPLAHPYFSAYRDLQQLCLMILCHRAADYSGGRQGVWGLVFMGWWLWEAYLAAVLAALPLTHADNYGKRGGIRDAEGRDRYPDFYAADGDDKVILDAKYKEADRCAAGWRYLFADKKDLKQMLTYLLSPDLQARRSCQAALLYPSIEDGTDSSAKICASLHPWGHSRNAHLHLIRMPIPRHAGNYSAFVEWMASAEASLLNLISKWLPARRSKTAA